MSELMRRVPDVASLSRTFAEHELLFAVVRSLDEALETDWAHERRVMQEVLPGLRIPRAPWREARSAAASPRPPGGLGADNAEVLHEVLSLGDAEIESLGRRSVLRSRGA